jgi:hypothetical protein
MADRSFWSTLRIFRYSLVLILFPFVHYSGFLATDADKADALQLANTFHAQMTHGDSDGIYDDADKAFQNAVSRDHHGAYLASIASHWGTPLDCTPSNIGVRFGFGSKMMSAECSTRFSSGYTALEKFKWKKTDNVYHLYYYAFHSK